MDTLFRIGLAGRFRTINNEVLPGNKTGLITTQKKCRLGNIQRIDTLACRQLSNNGVQAAAQKSSKKAG